MGGEVEEKSFREKEKRFVSLEKRKGAAGKTIQRKLDIASNVTTRTHYPIFAFPLPIICT